MKKKIIMASGDKFYDCLIKNESSFFRGDWRVMTDYTFYSKYFQNLKHFYAHQEIYLVKYILV